MLRFLPCRSTLAVSAALACASLVPVTALASRDVSFEQAYCAAASSTTGFCRVAVPEGDFTSVEPVHPDGFGIAPLYPDIEGLIAPWVFAGTGKPEWSDNMGEVKLSTDGDTLTQWVAVPRRTDPSEPRAFLVQVTYRVTGPHVAGPGLYVELHATGASGPGVSTHFPDAHAGTSGRSATHVARLDHPQGGDIGQVRVHIRHAAGAAAVVVSDVKLIMADQ